MDDSGGNACRKMRELARPKTEVRYTTAIQ